ncbi:hypothetical protein NE865_09555 [Phthorimaea operculella]|nr:hypothetical protein NE865_09555 [Phthorimaea operculella]
MDLSEQLSGHGDDIAKLYAQMGDFEERLLKATTSKVPDPAHSDLAALSRDFNNFKTFVWQVLGKLKAQTSLLAIGLDRHETFLRRKVLLFHGIPENKDEQLNKVVTDIITNQMKLTELTADDLQVCHRLGTNSTKPRAVLVRFHDLDRRRMVWDSKTSLKGTGIVISEFLTKARHTTFLAARKHFGVSKCWSSKGKITVILPDQSSRKIEVLSELQELIKRFPEPNRPKPAPATLAQPPPSGGSKQIPAKKPQEDPNVNRLRPRK